MIYNAKAFIEAFDMEPTTTTSDKPDKEQASSSSSTSLGKMRIVANTGDRMDFDDTSVVLDMDNLTMSTHTETDPILYNHNWQEPIGHATAIAMESGRLIIDADISCVSEKAKEIQASLQNGFPWQASLGFSILGGTDVMEGDSHLVNGRQESNCIIANNIDVWECSVVLFGADSKTQTMISAKQKTDSVQGGEVKMEDNKIIEAQADPIAEMREAQAKEQERIDALRLIANKYNAGNVADAIRNGTTAERFELEVLREAHANPAPAIHVEASRETPLGKDVLSISALRMAGLPTDKFSEQALEATDKLGTQDFRAIVEAATGYNPTTAQRANGIEWLAGASTYNLDVLLVQTSNDVLEQSWQVTDDTWKSIFKQTSVPDFKTYKRYEMYSDYKFKKIARGGEMPHGRYDDSNYSTIAAETYGRQEEITWQDIVDGQALGVWSDILTRFAYGASQAVNEAAWAGFLNQKKRGDQGHNFFDVNNGNLGQNLPLTFDNLAQAATNFVMRKKDDPMNPDDLLGLTPAILLVPYSLKFKADLITHAVLQGDSTRFQDYNPHAGQYNVIATPMLENASFGGRYSSEDWYLLTNPSVLSVGELVFLNGQQTPTIRQADLNIGKLGVGFDAHIDFGYGPGDYRAGYMCDAQ